jgi:TIR domain-containing protein
LAEAAPSDDVRTHSYDVFISHASEDKSAVVTPLANALRQRGLSVWFDNFELKIGDSLRRKIDTGISRSRFGIVVLSPAFFAKGWPQYELDGLVTMAISGKQVLLPLWHGVSKDEVVSQSPSLADKVALRTADYTIDEIAEEITPVVQADQSQ